MRVERKSFRRICDTVVQTVLQSNAIAALMRAASAADGSRWKPPELLLLLLHHLNPSSPSPIAAMFRYILSVSTSFHTFRARFLSQPS